MSSDRENPEQIPSEENIDQTKAMVSEQGGVSGERKAVDVKDYPKAAAIGQILKDLDFPADKEKIIEYAERARPQSEEILQDLQKIEERQYENVSDVTKAAGLVRQ
jgi:glycerol dehydrogenase-like iron-containing ADH family enzyme